MLRSTSSSFIWALLLGCACAQAQGVITTVAGGGRIFRGDGGPATGATLGQLDGVAVDAAGNVFASDVDNNLVVRISPAGVLTVMAGNGIGGFSGDGGPATSASLNFPQGVAVDGAGNLYVADSRNGRIRKISANGTIATIAGNGQCCSSGDGGPATSASLGPAGVDVDASGNLYIAASNRIRKVSPAGIITTVAGSGTPGFSGDGGLATSAELNFPKGVAVDSAGNLYVADSNNGRIRKISANGTISTVAGGGSGGDGGPAVNAGLGLAHDVAVDAAGNLYIAETTSRRIRKVNPGGIISTIAGIGTLGFSGDGGPATAAALTESEGIAVDGAGNLYIADSANNRIRKVNAAGTIMTIAGVGPQAFGDGGPATSAALSRPKGLAFDGAGNLYIGDQRNHRIRKVSPSGVITTVAGNGIAGFSGDGGSATAAALHQPAGVAVDSVGNLYFADSSNARIRRVTPGGTISTVAGGGSGGDGGPAVNAALGGARDVAVDAAGNLYIAETFQGRIRKVNPGGIISTVAGIGTLGFSGDGGPATAAALNGPEGIAVDGAGNLYIADFSNVRVRKVSPAGIIITVAGGGTSGDDGPAASAKLDFPSGLALDTAGNLYIAENPGIRKVDIAGTITKVAGGAGLGAGFSGDGGLGVNAMLNLPSGVAVDAAGNLYIADTVNDRIRKVLAASPPLSLAPTSLSFTVSAGAPASAPQPVTVSSPLSGLQWNAQARTADGGNWLSVSPLAGSTPGTISLSVDATSLTPGTYTGSLTVQAPLASTPTQTVAVQLTVGTPGPAQLAVEPSSLGFQGLAGGSNPPSQTLRITNLGGGTMNWTAQATTNDGGAWLTVSPASGSASGVTPGAVQVTANGASLQPGSYSGIIQVNSSTTGETKTVAVNLLLLPATSTILVSQSGILFTGVEGGGALPSQSSGILNTGQGVMNWTVDASTLSGGNWLSVSPSSGSSTANSLEVPLVDATVNIAGLRAGQYGGLIRVSSAGANNSPQFVAVVLNVLPAGSSPAVAVRPTGLIFTAQAGTSSPGSQTVRLSSVSPRNISYISGLLTTGGDWLQALPSNAVLSPADPSRTIVLQPTLGSLATGVYRGAVTLLFDDGSPAQVINVLFVVVGFPTGTAPAPAEFSDNAQGSACAPQKLLAVQRILGSSFSSQVGWPTAIEVQVADDCGNAVSSATVVASFSNGDPPLALSSLRNGTYAGTWRPVNVTSQVTVTARATLPPLTAAEVQAQGLVGSNPSAPALFAGGVVSAASFGAAQALAPGEIVAVFGRNLAVSTAGASTVPLPKTLGGATLSVGGMDVPLFYSSNGQINAQLPFEVATNSRLQAVVRRTDAVTVPETITLAPAHPGIFAANQQGTGQGAILNVQGQIVDASAPAAANSVVQVFVTGLGATNPAVASGTAAPGAEPLARVVTPVTARVGGQTAAVQFAGLAPNFVGLYQVNVQIPTGIAPSSAIPLVLFQNGVPSNTVTLAMR